MTVDLGDLVPALEAALNVPGDAAAMFDFSVDGVWVDQLSNGFWSAWLLGFYQDYRVTVGGDGIENVVDNTIELSRGDQQVLILQAALTAIGNKFATIFTHAKDVAGPVSTERDRSGNLLKDLYDSRRADLEAVRKQMLSIGSTSVAVIDMVLARTGADFFYGYGSPFVNG